MKTAVRTPRVPKLRETIDGPETLCTRCGEWWPANTEFFFTDHSHAGGLVYRCKACCQELKTELAMKKAGRAA